MSKALSPVPAPPWTPSPNRSWTFRLGTLSRLEVDHRSVSLWFGRWDIYARLDHLPGWFTVREPGSVEVMAGRVGVTVSWASAHGMLAA